MFWSAIRRAKRLTVTTLQPAKAPAKATDHTAESSCKHPPRSKSITEGSETMDPHRANISWKSWTQAKVVNMATASWQLQISSISTRGNNSPRFSLSSTLPASRCSQKVTSLSPRPRRLSKWSSQLKTTLWRQLTSSPSKTIADWSKRNLSRSLLSWQKAPLNPPPSFDLTSPRSKYRLTVIK